MNDSEDQTTQDENAAHLATRDPSTVAASPHSAPPSPAKPPLERVGNYRLVRALGRGGMGEVWLAEHVENPILQCAVKFIRPDQRHPGIAERFQRERESLVRLRHEHIIKVHDLGVTDTGLPYLVMEYVAGQPLDAFCDARRLGLRQRLELFLQVCRAVQHAHRQGLIHRDLKPANILVTEIEEQGRTRPVAKVIDFGIARALETPDAPPAAAAAAPLDAHLTQTGAFIGSVLYASPEQLLGQPADTRADVYALGKILYQLLSGTLPVTPEELQTMLREARQEVWQRLASTEIKSPSAKLRTLTDSAPEKLAEWAAARGLRSRDLPPLLTHEFDWIALRALAGEPDRRYPSVEAFAADVERYLRDEVIEARPPEWSYRLGKFWRRHRTPLTAAALIVASLVTALAVSVRFERKATAEAKRANEEKGRAETQRKRAEKLAESEASQRIAADKQRSLAETARTAQRKQLDDASMSDHAAAEACMSRWEWPEGIAYLGRALERNAANRAAQMHLWTELAWSFQATNSTDFVKVPLPTRVRGVDLSPNGKSAVVSSEDERTLLVTVPSGKILWLSATHGQSSEAFYSADGNRVLVRAAIDTAVVLATVSGQVLRKLSVAGMDVSPFGMDSSGRFAVVTTGVDSDQRDGRLVQVHDIASGRSVTLPNQPKEAMPLSAIFSPDARWLLIRYLTGGRHPDEANRSRLYDTARFKLVGSGFVPVQEIEWVEFAPDSKAIVISSHFGFLSLLEVPSLKELVPAFEEEHPSPIIWPAGSDYPIWAFGNNPPQIRGDRLDLYSQMPYTDRRAVDGEWAHGRMAVKFWCDLHASGRVMWLSPQGTFAAATTDEDGSMRLFETRPACAIPLLDLQVVDEQDLRWSAGDAALAFIDEDAAVQVLSFDRIRRPTWPDLARSKDRDSLSAAGDSPPTAPKSPVEGFSLERGETLGSFDSFRLRHTSSGFWSSPRIAEDVERALHAREYDALWRATENGVAMSIRNRTIVEFPVPRHLGEPESWLADLVFCVSGRQFAQPYGFKKVPLRDRLAARERLRALKLDGADADVKDPAWARLLKWWLTPYPDRPPFP